MRFELRSDDATIVLIGGGVGDTIGWTLTLVEGWFGSPDVRENPIELTMEDGDYFPNTLSQGARTVTLSAFIKGVSSIELEAELSKLNGMIGKKIVLAGESADGYKECTGYISADPEPVINPYGQSATLDIIITCPDPYKYGAEAVYEYKPSFFIANGGTVLMYPVLRLQSANYITSVNYTVAGKTFKWAGYTKNLILDLKNMKSDSGYFVAPVLAPIKPGGDTVDIECNTSVTGTLSVRPAWR